MKYSKPLFMLLFLCTAYLASAQKVEKTTMHIVQKGETLYSVARQYDVSVANIKAWNRLNSEALYIGQSLSIYPDKTYDIPPLMDYALSQEYANRILFARVQRYNHYLFNVSGELEFYIEWRYEDNGSWRRDIQQFYTSASELDGYLQRLNALNALLSKRVLENEDRKKIVSLNEDIKSFERQHLAYLDRKGRSIGLKSAGEPRLGDVQPASYSGLVPIYPIFAAIRMADRAPVPHCRIYALDKDDINHPGCMECLTTNYRNCDVAAMSVSSGNLVKKSIEPGSYHFLITTQQSGLERIVLYERRKVTSDDDKKNVTFYVPDY